MRWHTVCYLDAAFLPFPHGNNGSRRTHSYPHLCTWKGYRRQGTSVITTASHDLCMHVWTYHMSEQVYMTLRWLPIMWASPKWVCRNPGWYLHSWICFCYHKRCVVCSWIIYWSKSRNNNTKSIWNTMDIYKRTKIKRVNIQHVIYEIDGIVLL